MTKLDKQVTKAITEVKRLRDKGLSSEVILEIIQKIEDPIIRRIVILEGLGYEFLEGGE